jgi:hypothetical protein
VEGGSTSDPLAPTMRDTIEAGAVSTNPGRFAATVSVPEKIVPAPVPVGKMLPEMVSGAA